MVWISKDFRSHIYSKGSRVEPIKYRNWREYFVQNIDKYCQSYKDILAHCCEKCGNGAAVILLASYSFVAGTFQLFIENEAKKDGWRAIR